MSIDAVFDGDYESAIIFSENICMKIVKYEYILACNSRYFNNFIIALVTFINAVFHEL
jgi:hypothetical protein